MTIRYGPGDGRPDPGLNAITAERRQLINLAYRLLGSLTEAEDAVQETFARWYAMSPRQQDAIASPGAWLTTVASRICLNLLGSARAQRETYVGAWLPEPLPEAAGWSSGPQGAPADPADQVTLDESVSMAFLVALESMTPAERVALILHDVFGYPLRRSGRDHRPHPRGMPPAGLHSPPPRLRRPRTRGPEDPAGQHRQGLQKGLGSQGHRRPHRPPRPGAIVTGDGGGLGPAALRHIEGGEHAAWHEDK